ncbi:hypothetical protein F5B22DRAFT_600701 [Xylaria bambusicola]|uniref:uncharacterized protein n=1 Tax=Xylaria bambusicola TaxID=326684 RepID=UPI002008E6D1|nr:uncharacterized protein F5B22DRAFT_600701 [Xylaria bambusicola]KAI0518305.1 hypothetical protein F5B22DRAFT_600701 [Xylaria bambusicola]
MNMSSAFHVLLLMAGSLVGVCGVSTKGIAPNNSIIAGINISSTAEALHAASINLSRDSGNGQPLTPQNNYNGWVNPEDLTPMPQCIAQQDQSAWLSVMTKCTSKRCTSHFGFICTHGQWLTQLSCLSVEFSPDVVRPYLPYCGRSVLAKAQLYQWIRHITGRTWLVDVGDGNGLQNLSPASLAKGYAPFDVTYDAPACLTSSASTPSMELFQHVIASCSFTGLTQHTGNAARPWEYSASLKSMIVLDTETVGYDLIQRSLGGGDYFDKECFCSSFTMDTDNEPCSRPGQDQIDLTKERLWLNATCGPTSLSDHWTDRLKTTGFAYIPVEDWQWPRFVADMSKRVAELPDKCATDACEVDSRGYCKVRRAVDRACFCHNISYESCGSSCQMFETRIEYVKWLHDLCGNVHDWHGLPDTWRQLAAPTVLDLIPWRWTMKPSKDSDAANITGVEPIRATETCPSNEWKLGSLALVNLSALLAAYIGGRTTIHRLVRSFSWHVSPRCWVFNGIVVASLQLLANWLNAFLVQTSPGYEDVPLVQSILFWCTMPRPTWVLILLLGVKSFEPMDLSPAKSFLFAEIILQFLSSYYMVMTVNYGRQHNFYFGGLERVERGGSANVMYAGALVWLAFNTLAIFQLLRVLRYMRLKEKLTRSLMDEIRVSEETPLKRGEGRDKEYGTLSGEGINKRVSQKVPVGLYGVVVITMLLWIAQWLFWGGFLGLSLEEFCPPRLETLTAVWVAISLAGITVGTTTLDKRT